MDGDTAAGAQSYEMNWSRWVLEGVIKVSGRKSIGLQLSGIDGLQGWSPGPWQQPRL